MSIRKTLRDISNLLEQSKKAKLLSDYVLIGGLAVSFHGVTRSTEDVDFAVLVEDSKCNDLAQFLKAEYRVGDPEDPLRGVFIREDEETGTATQLIRFPGKFSDVIFANPVEAALDEDIVRLISWKGIILLKLYAGSALDLEDAKHVLSSIHPSKAELDELAAKAKEFGLDLKMMISEG